MLCCVLGDCAGTIFFVKIPLFWGDGAIDNHGGRLGSQERKNGPCFKIMFRALIRGGAVPVLESRKTMLVQSWR